jgi:hypothetical protein
VAGMTGTGVARGADGALLARLIVVLAVLVSALTLVVWPLFGAHVPVGRCGVGVVRFDDRAWTVVAAQAFNRSSAPAHWQGLGIVTSVGPDRLTYRDLSGASLTFSLGGTPSTGCS